MELNLHDHHRETLLSKELRYLFNFNYYFFKKKKHSDMITRGHMKGPSDKNRVLNTKNLQDG